MRVVGGEPTESDRLYALAGALMGGGPVWHYLYVNHYPFAQAEAIALPAGAALIGAALTVMGRRIGGMLGAFGFGALLYLFVDLQFDLEKLLPSVVILGGCLAAPILIRARRAALTSITLGAFYLASLPRGGASAPIRAPVQATKADLPLLVHVILDEQWGVGGLRAEGDSATAAFLTDFYRERGFELFEAAYSRFYLTMESIPSALSLGQVPAYNPATDPGWARSLRTIPYFERLRSRGYEIHVSQTSHLDYCHAPSAPVTSCVTQTANSIANTGHLRGDWLARASQTGRYFLTITSHLYARFYPNNGSWTRSITGGGLFAIDNVRHAITTQPLGGAAFLVHLLLPHGPIDVDAECRALWNRAWRPSPTNVNRSDSSWREMLRYEGGQIRCAHRALSELLAAVDNIVGRDHSIIIVHGDHGSRLNQNRSPSTSLATLDRRALNSRFSTLLAIRRPGVPGAVYSEPVPVQDFLWELARNDFGGSVRGPWRHFVRDRPRDSASADTVRSLAVPDMLWVSSPGWATAVVDSTGVHR